MWHWVSWSLLLKDGEGMLWVLEQPWSAHCNVSTFPLCLLLLFCFKQDSPGLKDAGFALSAEGISSSKGARRATFTCWGSSGIVCQCN